MAMPARGATAPRAVQRSQLDASQDRHGDLYYAQPPESREYEAEACSLRVMPHGGRLGCSTRVFLGWNVAPRPILASLRRWMRVGSWVSTIRSKRRLTTR